MHGPFYLICDSLVTSWELMGDILRRRCPIASTIKQIDYIHSQAMFAPLHRVGAAEEASLAELRPLLGGFGVLG